MKLKSLYSFLLATALVACNEDFNEGIAGVQTADPESPAATVSFSATAASATTIDLGALEEGVTNVKVCTFSATPSTETTIVTHVLDLRDAENVSYKVDLNANGEASVEELQTIIETVYNKRPEARSFDAYVYEYLNTDGQSLIGKSDKITIIMTPKAPIIESAYYYIGQTNNWTAGDNSAEVKFSHSGKDVYEDPIFTITVKAPYNDAIEPERVDMWFKIVPQSAMDVFAAEGQDAFWGAGILGSDTKDGDDRKEAKLLAGGGSFVQKATDEAKFYTITLNMMEYTMTVEPLTFEEYIYIPGNHQVGVAGAESWGWTLSVAPALRSEKFDGIYTGYSYLNGGFKFTRNRENWNGEYNSSHFTQYGEGLGDDGGNISMSIPGFYYIEADMPKKTLTATATTWGIIGPAQAGGWNSDTDMEWNVSEECWVATLDLAADEFKFRANDDWGINVGGNMDDLVKDGGNIRLEEAGTYEVKLYLTRSTSDKLYCTVTKK